VHRGGGAGIGLEIGDDRNGFGSDSLGLVPHLLDHLGTIDERKPAAFAGHPERDGLADALRRAGDNGDLAGEASRVARHHRPPCTEPGSDVVDVHHVVDVVIL
jgi:hypothetical protein